MIRGSRLCLVGASGSRKTTLARALFRPGEVRSSDALRELVANDGNAQAALELRL